MKMSKQIEQAYEKVESVGAEMTVKQMEGLNYKKALKDIQSISPILMRLKRSLRERGQ